MNEMTAVMRHRADFARSIANKRYELAPNGILFPEQKLFVGGVFEDEHRRYEPTAKRRRQLALSRLPLVGPAFRRHRLRQGGGDVIGHGCVSANIIPTEGLDHILSTIVAAGTQVTSWAVGIFEANVTPAATLTHATLVATLTECTAYDETTRVAYVEGAVSAGAVDNSASRAVFTMNATKTVYGGFLASSNVKSTTSAGTCLAAAKFSASRAVVAADELAVKYSLSATST